MGVKKLFVWLILGVLGGILLFSNWIPQSTGVMAQEYEPANEPVSNTTAINTSAVIETVIRPPGVAENRVSDISGNLTSEAGGGVVENSEVTVYEQGIALVKERREIRLQNGINQVAYTDIPSGIDPTSVIIEDPENEDTVILEQNYEYDVLNSSSLLEKYLGREVNVTDRNGEMYTGILLSHAGNSVVLSTEAGEVVVLEDFSKAELADSSGLSVRPALIWQIYSPVSGTRELTISYLTSGMNWEAAYVLISNAENTEADIRGWASIDNRAGLTYENAVLRLVSGQINRVSQPITPVMEEKAVADETVSQAPFVEEPFFEYHFYTLENPVTLENNQAKQISLLSADSVPVEKKLIYDISVSEKILAYLTLQNTNESGLGMPLPAGVVRIYSDNASGGLQFIGEDRIRHTPESGELRVTVGSAFDLTARRNETNYQRISDNVERVTYQIELNNSKSEDQAVTVVEHLYGEWEILESSDSYEEIDAFTVEFRVTVPARGTKLVSYTVERRF
ncbi:DUF4139 domain-containing protein [Methanosarcina sp. MSH10X1]|uniref:DUF4139 domain-containing protein n=1 Tax=Methanosarcina sp. MSH10X1 TaxID=2507075 RepID=UPI000FFBF271|nr:DUF4139 domain-containing protein [Methanosarcina sp. MSH10X1]RXA20771.1 DUF4139 domain-containing protein [Methanosarcina sp. MSH10X1]